MPVIYFWKPFSVKFKFGTNAHGPGQLHYFGVSSVQHDDFVCRTDGHDMLTAFEPALLTRLRCKAVADELNELAKSVFTSLNSSLRWFGTTISPFCSATAKRLQRCIYSANVSCPNKQKAAVQKLRRLGSTITFGRPRNNQEYSVSVLVCTDAVRPSTSAQLSTIYGVVRAILDEGSISHTVPWSLRKSKRSVRCFAAGKILAASERTDKVIMLKQTHSLLLGLNADLTAALGSEDLQTTLLTQRQSITRSVRADVSYSRYQFEVCNANWNCWILGHLNLADPGTKSSSSPSQALQLVLSSRKLPCRSPKLEASNSRDKPLGQTFKEAQPRKRDEYQMWCTRVALVLELDCYKFKSVSVLLAFSLYSCCHASSLSLHNTSYSIEFWSVLTLCVRNSSIACAVESISSHLSVLV